MKIHALPAFEDNYIWLLQNGADAIVIDPGDAKPVLDVVQTHQLRLRHIVLTHHHADHTGGVAELKSRLHAKVIAPDDPRIREVDLFVKGGDSFTLDGFPRIEVIATPGHTASHVSYRIESALFCGDTLFSLGCGRVFDGTPEQLHHSLQSLAQLPPDTRVYCTHEYTLANGKFAQVLEPDHLELRNHLAWCRSQRDQLLPTLPSSIALERALNPFLRLHSPAILAAVAHRLGHPSENDIQTFRVLREWKNEFRG